jgi:hypothetical protein
MKTILVLTIAFILATQLSVAQQQPASQAPASNSSQQPRFASGTILRVELVKSVDAKKAKPGDPVVAKTREDISAGGKVVAPRGAAITGHVVSATPHHGDTPSTLEIAFDQMAIGGTEVPMKAVIQALTKPAQAAMPADYGSSAPAGQSQTGPPMGSPNGGRLGGGTPTSAPTPNNGGVGDANGMPVGNSAPPSAPLPSNAQGAIGMSDLSLSTGQQGTTVLTSQKHNVKLEDGTQMIIRVTQ